MSKKSIEEIKLENYQLEFKEIIDIFRQNLGKHFGIVETKVKLLIEQKIHREV